MTQITQEQALEALAERYGMHPGLKEEVAALLRGAAITQQAPVSGLRLAAKELIDNLQSEFKPKRGPARGLQAEDGEKCYIIHSDYVAYLEGALSQTPTPAPMPSREEVAIEIMRFPVLYHFAHQAADAVLDLIRKTQERG